MTMGGDPVSVGTNKAPVNLNPLLVCILAFVAGVIFQSVKPVLPCGESCKCCEIRTDRNEKKTVPPIKPGPAP